MTQRWTCPKCKREYEDDVIRLPIIHSCGYIDREGSTIVSIDGGMIKAIVHVPVKAARYSKSTVAWMAEGCPVRTDEEVDRIFREHCAVCPGGWFQNDTCTHKDCGCQIRTSAGERITLFGITISAGFVNNKLRRATEHCPIGEW
jgi:hypothetical protein